MAPSIKHQQLLPENQQQVDLLEFFGLGWAVDDRFDVDMLDADRRVQVRDSNHYAPSAPVKWMVQQMAYSPLPYPIVTKDRYVADGNTRIRAYKVRKQRFTPIIVVDANYEDAPPDVRAKLEVIAAAFNSQHGTALTAPERQRAASTAFQLLRLAPEHYSRLLGLKPSDVTAINQEMGARTRMEKVGIDIGEGKSQKLHAAALRALGRQGALNLNDEPYAALTNLAIDAGLTSPEIGDLAVKAKDTGSDTKALEFLGEQRQEMAERIVQKRLTGVGHPSAAGQLRRAIGFILKFETPDLVAQLVETNPAEIERHMREVTQASDILAQVLHAQATYQPALADEAAAAA